MIKLSKESKWVFFSLLFVPVIWIGLNYAGVVDYLENKSVDLRFKVRGNLDHRSASNESVLVDIESNQTVPKIPKVIYVNFDAATLSLDEVGERPWNRSFFRDVASYLLKEGQARVVGFDFLFSPKSSSSMVPEENVYMSDSAIAQLIEEFPSQVVVASAYTRVQTQFLKNENVNFLSDAPFFKEGYDPDNMKVRYPEGPTYPILNYVDGKYVGLNGLIFSQPSEVDGLNREIGVWFPAGGKAHAYNIMGAKLSKLKLEGFDFNQSKYPELLEDEEMLKLVWADSNGTLIDTVPNSIPLVRERDFYTLGLECLLAYYGVDENAVELSEKNDQLTVKSISGDTLLKVPLYDQQLMEINWFSNWQELQPRDRLFEEIKEFYDLNNSLSYVNSGKELIELMFKEFSDFNSTQFDLDRSLHSLSDFEMDAEDIETISFFLQHDKSDSLGNIPDYTKLEKALVKLGLNMNLSNPNLEGSYNPMCSMSDLINFGQNKKIIEGSISDLEENLLPSLKINNQKFRKYFYQFCGDENASKLWEELHETEESLTRNYELYNNTENPDVRSFVKNNIRDQEKQKTKLLSDLVSFEKNYANARVFENNVSYSKDITAMDLAMKSNNAKINSLTEEFDAKKNIIVNLKNSVLAQPDIPVIQQSLDNAITEKNEISEKISLIFLKNLSLAESMYVKYSDVLTKNKAEIRQFDKFFANFQDSIVLIGPEEKTFQDLAPTPMDKEPEPKVSVHGNVIKTLSSEIFIKRMFDNKEATSLIIFLLCLISAGLSAHSSSWTSWVGILVLGGFVAVGLFLFSTQHIVIPMAAPALAGLNTYVFGLAAMVVIEQKAKGKLKGMFGSYVSSDLVEQMVESGDEPKLGGEETAITAFFSDVQAFSSFSELLTPTGLVDLMNEYLTAMTNILQDERGTLDKYIGDAIVAMYGAPIPMKDHAYQAVRTAILMQQKQIQLREKWVPEVEKWGKCHGLVTQMQTRIGCNTGTATVGNMGALDRFNYTMMGDMVNLAARCESGAKAYGAYIMVTEETKTASLSTKDDIAFRYLDKIVVKGRSQPVAMYEPTGFMNELSQETQDCLDCFQKGIDNYLKQDWDGALKLFEQAKELEPNKPGVTPGVKDNPSMILIDRCQIMKENPPGDDWDGVYVMTTK